MGKRDEEFDSDGADGAESPIKKDNSLTQNES